MKTQENLNNIYIYIYFNIIYIIIYIKSQPHGLERELGLQKIS